MDEGIGSATENQGLPNAITEDDTAAKTGSGGIFGLFGNKDGQNARKTVTFGDASAVRSKPFWSILSLLLIVVFWWVATKPFGFPDDYKPQVDAAFELAADESAARAAEQEATDPDNPNKIEVPSRTPLERDYITRCQLDYNNTKTEILDEQEDALSERFEPEARATVTERYDDGDGTSLTDINFESDIEQEIVRLVNDEVEELADEQAPCSPNKFTQFLSPRTMPSPSDTWAQFNRLRTEGYKGTTLFEHARVSLWRVLRGMFFGSLIGIPIGFAMGLSSRLRGFFDTPVEGFRPIPPLAILPLFILWFGIGDGTAVRLLIFASVWIMIIAARAGARTVKLSKVRAAYSLGASRWQVLRRVILPNALPELFTGARVALGVSWGTLVAAELVGADTGLGAMIFLARNFLQTDIVVVGIIIIALIGVLMDVIMRFAESKLIPWRGKG